MKRILPNKTYVVISFLAFLFCAFVIEAQTAKVNIPLSSKQTIYGRITNQCDEPLNAQVQVWYYNFQEVTFSVNPAEAKGRTDNLIGVAYSDDLGFYSVEVPADTILVIVTKGPEWELIYDRMIIQPEEFDGIQYNVSLNRLYDLEKLGWYAGDTHTHSIHSDGHQRPSKIANAMKSVGLSWGILTDHNSISGSEEWLGNQTNNFIPIVGNEITTEPSLSAEENGYGHMNQTFITELNGTDPSNPNIWARAVMNGNDDVRMMIEKTHKQNGLISVNHPYSAWDWAGRFKSWGLVNGYDIIEIWNGEPPHSPTVNLWDTLKMNISTYAVHTWFEFLNSGNKITGLAGSDCHDVTGKNAYPKGKYFWNSMIGNPRTYAHINRLDKGNIKQAIKDGNLFLTSCFGPLLLVNVEGKYPGEVVSLSDKQQVKVSIEVLANHPLLNSEDGVRIIFNGRVVKSFNTVDELKVNKNADIDIACDGWIIVEAFGPYPMYAITNPIYIDVQPLGDWPVNKWIEPDDSMLWNTFSNHPEITIPNGPSNWKDSGYIFNEINNE